MWAPWLKGRDEAQSLKSAAIAENGSVTFQSAALGDSFILINKRMTNYTPGAGSMRGLVCFVPATNWYKSDWEKKFLINRDVLTAGRANEASLWQNLSQIQAFVVLFILEIKQCFFLPCCFKCHSLTLSVLVLSVWLSQPLISRFTWWWICQICH